MDDQRVAKQLLHGKHGMQLQAGNAEGDALKCTEEQLQTV